MYLSEEERREAIETLLAGHLDAGAQAALEARLHEDNVAWEDYVALRALGNALSETGEAFSHTVPSIDLVDDIMLCVDLEALGEAAQSAAPEVDLLGDIMLRADLIALGEQAAEAAPGVDLVADVMLQADLAALGEQAEAAAPAIDLVESVMAAVTAESRKSNVVPLRSAAPARRRPATAPARSFYAPFWLGFAAAACLIVGFWFAIQSVLPSTQGNASRRQLTRETSNSLNHRNGRNENGRGGEEGLTRVSPHRITSSIGTLDDMDDQPAPETEAANPYATLTLEQILLARRNAIEDTGADRALLAQLASLSPEEARALLEQAGISTEAVLGAAMFLPPAEATNLLLAQLGLTPNDPYLRYALAKNLSAQGASAEQQRSQLAEWQKLDPENGLPCYMEGQLELREGNLEAALAAFTKAEGLGSSYPYSADTARYRQQALMAAGMGTQEAQLLAAATAGSQEYLHIREVAADLLTYGDAYAASGDYETAEQIYSAVQQYGEDVASGATYVNEELAGLQTQDDALTQLQALYEVFSSPETMEALTQSFSLLALAFQDLQDYIESYNNIFNSGDMSLINSLTGLVLDQGDLNAVSE